MGKRDAGARAAVGDDLAAVLPAGRWHKKAHLIKLNFVVGCLVLFCMCTRFMIHEPPSDISSFRQRIRWLVDERSPGFESVERPL